MANSDSKPAQQPARPPAQQPSRPNPSVGGQHGANPGGVERRGTKK